VLLGGGRLVTAALLSGGEGQERTVFLCSGWRRRKSRTVEGLRLTGGVTASCSGPGVWKGAQVTSCTP